MNLRPCGHGGGVCGGGGGIGGGHLRDLLGAHRGSHSMLSPRARLNFMLHRSCKACQACDRGNNPLQIENHHSLYLRPFVIFRLGIL